jgi:hypothetical protein
MSIDKALGFVGATMMMEPGFILFGLAFLISTIWSAFVRDRSVPGYVLWSLVVVANLPFVIFVSRAVANERLILSNFDLGTSYVLFFSGGLGIGWLIGCIFGLLIRVGAVGVRDALQ